MPQNKSITKLLLLAFLVFGVRMFAQQIISPEQAKGKKILLVAGESEKAETNDDPAIKSYLEKQGYVVTMANEEDAASKAEAADLVLLSSTADPREIGDKLAGLAKPVFTWNTVDYPDMKMTGPERHVDFETLDPVQDFMRTFSDAVRIFSERNRPYRGAIRRQDADVRHFVPAAAELRLGQTRRLRPISS